MAHETEVPAVAGKHAADLSMFRGSSQDGQYQPWDPELSPTLKMKPRSEPEPEPTAFTPARRPTSSSTIGYALKDPPSNVAPSPNPARALGIESKPQPDMILNKGWVDHDPKAASKKRKIPCSPESVSKVH